MSNQVYANNMEISCKQAAGKSICAFPDVCMTPPQTPATPPGVPIPYPNTGMASDTTDGSTSVKISDQEVMLKNKSYFKKSTGDEAGAAPMKGVVTHKNTGKVYFTAWSMDVKVESENVVRMLDMTTHNHASQGPNTPPMVYFDEVSVVVPEACRNEANEANEACAGAKKRPKRTTSKGSVDDGVDCSDECKAKQKCILVPKKSDSKACCHPSVTGHHMIEDHWIKDNPEFPWYKSDRTVPPQSLKLTDAERISGMRTVDDAPCVCVEGSRNDKEHGEMHAAQGLIEESYMDASVGSPNRGKLWNFGAAKSTALISHDMVFGGDGNCSPDCLKAQMDSFYGDDESRTLNEPSRQSLLTDPKKQGIQRTQAEMEMKPFVAPQGLGKIGGS